MTQLFHCRTHYHTDPPVDINPLVLERYKKDRVLVLCARDAQCKRIYKLMNQEGFYPDIHLVAYGWWEAEEMGLIQIGELSYKEIVSYDAVVILNKERIDKMFKPLANEVEEFLECELLLPVA